EMVDADLSAGTDIERAADGPGRQAAGDDALCRIIDKSEVARLLAIAMNQERLAAQSAQHELRDDFATIAFVLRPRAEGIEWANDRHGIAIGAPESVGIAFASELRRAIHGHRPSRMLFRHRCRLSGPIDFRT